MSRGWTRTCRVGQRTCVDRDPVTVRHSRGIAESKDLVGSIVLADHRRELNFVEQNAGGRAEVIHRLNS